MTKLDLTKKYPNYFKAKSKPELVELPPAQYLSIQGTGDPSGPKFSQKVQALYTTAYAQKFKYKAEDKDFVVSKLEGLWDYDIKKYPGLTMEEVSLKVPRSSWNYRLMIRMPEWVTKANIDQSIQQVFEKKGLAEVKKVAWFEMEAGRAVQILHLGPYSKELESLLKIQSYMSENGLEKNGLHHEIYLSDFRKTPTEKLRTILREPVL